MKPESYFNTLAEWFNQESGVHQSCKYVIGGCVFKLVFLSDRVQEAFFCPFDCAEVETPSDFTVYIGDSSCADRELPACEWSTKDYLQKGEIAGFQSDGYRLVYDVGARALSMACLSRREAIFWTPDLCVLPFWERGSPLRNIIHWFLPLKNRYMTHAAAVGSEEGGVLIVGKGGSGKSTTALTCLKEGLGYCSDDYCAIADEEAARVFRVYNTAKVFSGKEKVVVDMKERYPKQMLASFPLQAVLLPRIGHQSEARIIEAKKSVLLREMSASTMLQLPGKNREMLPFFRRVVEKVPCFILELSRHLPDNVRVIRECLEESKCLLV